MSFPQGDRRPARRTYAHHAENPYRSLRDGRKCRSGDGSKIARLNPRAWQALRSFLRVADWAVSDSSGAEWFALFQGL